MAYLLLHKLPLLPLSLAEQYQSRYVAASYLTMCTTHYARPIHRVLSLSACEHNPRSLLS